MTPTPAKPRANRAENLNRLCRAAIGQTGWRMVQVSSHPVSAKGGSAFGGNPQTEKPVESQEVSNFWSFVDAYTAFAGKAVLAKTQSFKP